MLRRGGRVTKIPKVELAKCRKIPAAELELLWVNDWDDGPLEAVVEHAGQLCLMILHDEDSTTDAYRWLLLPLKPPQIVEELKWHTLFVEHVGDHWCFHGAKVTHPEPVGEAEPEKFHSAYKNREPLDLSDNEVLGWADEMPAH
jgi:hypothetical protein